MNWSLIGSENFLWLDAFLKSFFFEVSINHSNLNSIKNSLTYLIILYFSKKETKPMKPSKSKTPQPQKKIVSFWESNPNPRQKTTNSSSLLTTNSQSMVSLNNNNQEISKFSSKKQQMKTTTSEVCLHEVDDKRGFAPSDVAKDPSKREFLTNLSKRIFSPSDAITTRLSRQKQVSKSFRVRRLTRLKKSHT